MKEYPKTCELDSSVLARLGRMAEGQAQLFSADEMTLLRKFDPGLVICTKAVMFFEAWIPKEDLDKIGLHRSGLD